MELGQGHVLGVKGVWPPEQAGGLPCDVLKDAVPATVNGSPGALYGTWDQPLCVLGCTVTQGKIAEIHLIANRAKLRHLRLTFTPGLTQPSQ